MQILRIYVGSRDLKGGRPLHEVLVDLTRKSGLAGATVTRGMIGFGTSGTIHRASLRPKLNEFPLVIQIVDQPERIASFLPQLEPMIQDQLVTIQTVDGEQIRTRSTVETVRTRESESGKG